ncbi:MAG: hypothetical protein M1814_006396 [Vezdaea aestivalis]|nr:MAG: hypothetical protein M1814_006396 [Vezdaea aestivalis]
MSVADQTATEPSPHGLEPDCYTSQLLKHASPRHLDLTTRRLFIGPIPQGWLNSHRRQWYKQHLHINYSSRKATFSADPQVDTRTRRVTGFEGPSTTARFQPSFPQPLDVQPEESESSEDETESRSRTSARGKAVSEEDDTQAAGFAAQGGSTEVLPVDGAPAPTPLGRRRQSTAKSQQTTSFVTARETLTSYESANEGDEGETQGLSTLSIANPRHSASTGLGATSSRFDSQASLLRKASRDSRLDNDSVATSNPDEGRASTNQAPLTTTEPEPPRGKNSIADSKATALEQNKKRIAPGLVRFNVPDIDAELDPDSRFREARVSKRRSLRHRRKGQNNGEIIKMEKMLVRIETTMHEVPKDYAENQSIKIETQVVEKWREFMVVCRESPEVSKDSELCLQLYKTRVIPATQQVDFKKRYAHEIDLRHKTTFVNLYSSLDKSLVLWHPNKRGHRICIMRPRTAANGVEWHTFLRTALGWRRPDFLQVSVPDLNLTLELENPFHKLEAQRDLVEDPDDPNDSAMLQTIIEEQAVAGKIIDRCMTMLSDSPEWADILDEWSTAERMGLAWRRYDRLEWLYGANEQKMYGTVAMSKSHELELRPQRHYPTSVKEDEEDLTEPAPIEGFLVRLTSQRGKDQRLGKMFYKRLYYSTHNQYMCFCRPAKAFPPPPPNMVSTEGSEVPSTQQIAESVPLIYSVNPFHLSDGNITWLNGGTHQSKHTHDLKAYKEGERQVNLLLEAEGFINLCDVTDVRSFVRGAAAVDDNLGEGGAVDFHEDVDDETAQDDGAVGAIDDKRVFQLSLVNGLVIRLEAFDKRTKNEWIRHLRKLVRYWKLRVGADTDLLKSVRQSNLKELNIDEQMESLIGQFARKWEVAKAVASSELYNMCSISCCRTISISGILFYKPRRHSTFRRLHVILSHGNLLMFEHSTRSPTGAQRPNIQHERHSVINLRDCYIYSGLLTEGDLLHQTQAFDSHQAFLGSRSLPRVFVEDGWTANDEDTMICFVVWYGTRKSFFRSASSSSDQTGGSRLNLKRVTQLGKPGRGIVFKTRSRAERDQWVMNIGTEIERLQRAEEVRVTA